jgi:protein gp37
MASSTQIEWTDATWNPVTGCTKITRGCDFCYAERFSERFRGVAGQPWGGGSHKPRDQDVIRLK